MKTISKTAKKAELLTFAKENGITVNGSEKKEVIFTAIESWIASNKEEKASLPEAVENSRQAKLKDLPQKARLAKVFDTFHALLPEGKDKVKLTGVTASFWKAQKTSADFGGVTLRFESDASPKGVEKAIVWNILKALKSQGVTSKTIVLRRSGSGAIYV